MLYDWFSSFLLWFLPQSWTHNISKEKDFLRKLVKANVITDLTNGIWVYNPPPVSLGLSQRTFRSGSWEKDQPGERKNNPYLGGLHTAGVFISKENIRKSKDTGGFLWRVAHMCLLNQRLLLIEAGVARGPGEDWICRVPVSPWDSHRPPLSNVYHFTSLNSLVRAEVTCWQSRCQKFSLTYWLTWRRDRGERNEKEDCDGDGLSISSAKCTSYRGEVALLSFLPPECIHFPQCKYQRFLLCFLMSCSSPPPHICHLSIQPFIHHFANSR